MSMSPTCTVSLWNSTPLAATLDKLLRESAAVLFERMPAMTSRLRGHEREWVEQELLDPPAAERTIERLRVELAKLVPALTALRARQNQIAAELLDLVSRAR